MLRHTAPLLALTGLLAAGAAHASADSPVDGAWQKHEDTFSYMGFTSHYSCEGLSEKLKLMLKLAGARPDFKVTPTCAAPSGVPDRIATVRLTFHTFAPTGAPPPAQAKGKRPPAAPEPGVGAWRTVEWHNNSPREFESGDCELVEQFANEILPKFTTRDVVSHMNCVPHQVNPSGISLKFDALGPVPDVSKRAVADAR